MRLVRRGSAFSLASARPGAPSDPRPDIELQPLVASSTRASDAAHLAEDPLRRTLSTSALERPSSARDGARRGRRLGHPRRKRFRAWFDARRPGRTHLPRSRSTSSLHRASTSVEALHLQQAERRMKRLQLGLAVGLPLAGLGVGVGAGVLASGAPPGKGWKRLHSDGVEGIPYGNGTVSWSNGTMQYANGTMAPGKGPTWVPTGIFDDRRLRGKGNGTGEKGES